MAASISAHGSVDDVGQMALEDEQGFTAGMATVSGGVGRCRAVS